jgi:hypothetical protein
LFKIKTENFSRPFAHSRVILSLKYKGANKQISLSTPVEETFEIWKTV